MTTKLTDSFGENSDINESANKFMKNLNKIFHQSFRKVRKTKKPKKEESKVDKLMNERRRLRKSTDPKEKRRLNEVEEELAVLCAEKNFKTIENEVKNTNSEDGGLNAGKLWQMKRKLSPKFREPPSAKRDSSGNIISSEEALRQGWSLQIIKLAKVHRLNKLDILSSLYYRCCAV